MVRSMPRPDGRRYHSILEESTRRSPSCRCTAVATGSRPASRAALSKDTAALVASRYQFELLPQAGHYPAEEAPERVTDLLLAWLREVAPVTP